MGASTETRPALAFGIFWRHQREGTLGPGFDVVDDDGGVQGHDVAGDVVVGHQLRPGEFGFEEFRFFGEAAVETNLDDAPQANGVTFTDNELGKRRSPRGGGRRGGVRCRLAEGAGHGNSGRSRRLTGSVVGSQGSRRLFADGGVESSVHTQGMALRFSLPSTKIHGAPPPTNFRPTALAGADLHGLAHRVEHGTEGVVVGMLEAHPSVGHETSVDGLGGRPG